MMRKYARTNAEAHLYMDLTPCSCGEAAFDRRSAVITDDGVLCSRYAGPCRGCGARRTFVFELPEAIRPVRDSVEYGGDDPSRLLDPGEWMMVANERAKRPDGTRDDLDVARAAVEEVLKFLPPGAERVPDELFVTERGRAVRDAEPGRFRRVRLEAVLGAYRDLLAKPTAPTTAPAAPAAPATPAPAPAPTPSFTPRALALADEPLPVLLEALAIAAARPHVDPAALPGRVAELAGQLQAVLRMFEVKAADERQRAETSVEVQQLLDAIARTDTAAGRAIAQHRTDVAEVVRGLDLVQLSSSLQALVEWLRDPRNASQSVDQLLAQLRRN